MTTERKQSVSTRYDVCIGDRGRWSCHETLEGAEREAAHVRAHITYGTTEEVIIEEVRLEGDEPDRVPLSAARTGYVWCDSKRRHVITEIGPAGIMAYSVRYVAGAKSTRQKGATLLCLYNHESSLEAHKLAARMAYCLPDANLDPSR